jgi:hypothetical protein
VTSTPNAADKAPIKVIPAGIVALGQYVCHYFQSANDVYLPYSALVEFLVPNQLQTFNFAGAPLYNALGVTELLVERSVFQPRADGTVTLEAIPLAKVSTLLYVLMVVNPPGMVSAAHIADLFAQVQSIRSRRAAKATPSAVDALKQAFQGEGKGAQAATVEAEPLKPIPLRVEVTVHSGCDQLNHALGELIAKGLCDFGAEAHVVAGDGAAAVPTQH